MFDTRADWDHLMYWYLMKFYNNTWLRKHSYSVLLKFVFYQPTTFAAKMIMPRATLWPVLTLKSV